jgi:hypothetical protein
MVGHYSVQLLYGTSRFLAPLLARSKTFGALLRTESKKGSNYDH